MQGVIPRYATPEMTDLWSDRARIQRWIDIELLAVDALVEIGLVDTDTASVIRAMAPDADEPFLQEVARWEAETGHDVAALVDCMQRRIGYPEAKWVHYGLTSSDIVDTALAGALAAAGQMLELASTTLIEALRRQAVTHRYTSCLGRTHGMAAEPTTFGRRAALWALQVGRDRARLRQAVKRCRVAKLSGAVGTYSCVDPRVEELVCRALRLRPVPSGQVVDRDRHAELVWACASLGATVEMIALQVRLLHQDGVAEVRLAAPREGKGSSAMPHKRNPVQAERLCGLARVLRGHASAALEDVALWGERDISHSSVERIILPDCTQLAYWMAYQAAAMVDALEVRPAQMRQAMERSMGAMLSQRVLLALVAEGVERDRAYRLVQEATSMTEDGGDFRHVMRVKSEGLIDPGLMSLALDWLPLLDHAEHGVYERLEQL